MIDRWQMIARWTARSTALAATAALLSGCTILAAAEEQTDLYQATPKSTFEPDMPTVLWQLAVDVPIASANLNTGRIAISQSPTSYDYYTKTAWTDRAPLMVQTRIVDSFENSHKIVAVSRESIGLRANYLLQPDLRNFEAMYFYEKDKPPIAHIRVVAKLVRMPDRQIISVATFERCVRAREDKIPKVVEAFDQALGSVIKQLVAWTLKTPPAKLPDENTPYDINKFRNPANEIMDIRDCPVRGDTSMVPLADQ